MSRLLLTAGLLIVAVMALSGQVPTGTPVTPANLGYGQLPAEPGSFTFCRLMYRSVRSEALGSGWTTDYPSADQNLMIRLAELTTLDVSRGKLEEPLHTVVRATDRNVFRCPFLFASDVGTLGFLDAEVEALREYLLKGGFLWVDDFWGPRALEQFTMEMRRVLPDYQLVELTPEHPVFSTYFTLRELPQIPAISFWLATDGQTAERGGVDRDPSLYGISDPDGRLVVLMTHNTDIADGWEREADNLDFFYLFSPRGYAVGVNVVMWALTH
ncbi:MAG: DUF4159 domain-containing protein [Gemmatimonadota bacterium]